MSEEKYYSLWSARRSEIITLIKNGGGCIQLPESAFDVAGDRQRYTFRIEYKNGRPKRTGGSAVSRDLQDILGERYDFMKASEGKEVVIRMGVDFVVHHPKFADGIVTAIENDKVRIAFGEEEKLISVNYLYEKGIIE